MTEPSSGDPIDSANPPIEGELSPAVALAIPLGYGVTAGLLLAIGISGDTLTRLLRDYSDWAGNYSDWAGAFILSIVAIGCCLPIAVGVLGRPTRFERPTAASAGKDEWSRSVR